MYLKNSIQEQISNYLNSKFSKQNNKKLLAFVGDHIGTRILIKGFYEKDLLLSIISLFNQNSIKKRNFLDIGANIGNHSLFFSDYFNQVTSIEADPRIFKILTYNIEFNEITNIHPINVAASDQNEKLSFIQAKSGNLGTGKISLSVKINERSIEIDAVKLDDTLFNKIQNIDFIKLDIEGHELKALSGLVKIINANHPIISFESNEIKDFEDVTGFLKEQGYAYFYAYQYPFSNLSKYLRVLFRAVFNVKYKWKEILKNDRTCINDMVICSTKKLVL